MMILLLAETLGTLNEKLEMQENNLESTGLLRVNMCKTKGLFCGKALGTIKTSGKYRVVSVEQVVVRNSIYFEGYEA